MRIDHVAVYCKDFNGMKTFFVKYFGAMPGSDHISKRTGQTNCFLSFNDGGSKLELMTYPNEAYMNAEMGRQSMAHISINVGSIEQVNKLSRRLENDGFRILSGPRTTGDGYYESCIEAFEGLLIEITE
jgi:lactoylglutathione lyase